MDGGQSQAILLFSLLTVGWDSAIEAFDQPSCKTSAPCRISKCSKSLDILIDITTRLCLVACLHWRI